MNFGNFRALLKDFLNRKDLTDDQLRAITNVARFQLQRDHNVVTNTTRDSNFVYTVGGKDIGVDFMSFPFNRSIDIKNADGSWTPLEGTTFATEQRRNAPAQPWPSPLPKYYVLFLDGQTMLYLSPDQPATLRVLYNKFGAEYVNDTDTDLLLAHGYDALLWEALKLANVFTSDAEKVKIDEALSTKAVNALTAYSASILRSGAPVEVD